MYTELTPIEYQKEAFVTTDMTELTASIAHGTDNQKDFELLQSMEAEVTESIRLELALIQQLHPEWHQMYDETPPELCTAAELNILMRSAPNSFAKGLVAGAMKVRLEIAAITGRVF